MDRDKKTNIANSDPKSLSNKHNKKPGRPRRDALPSQRPAIWCF
jgi:hypothetical protein